MNVYAVIREYIDPKTKGKKEKFFNNLVEREFMNGLNMLLERVVDQLTTINFGVFCASSEVYYGVLTMPPR